jgi:hypothetical protein
MPIIISYLIQRVPHNMTILPNNTSGCDILRDTNKVHYIIFNFHTFLSSLFKKKTKNQEHFLLCGTNQSIGNCSNSLLPFTSTFTIYKNRKNRIRYATNSIIPGLRHKPLFEDSFVFSFGNSNDPFFIPSRK